MAVVPALSGDGAPGARARRAGAPASRVEAILRAVTDRTRLVALCNPNDPTGELLSVDALTRLLEALPERVVVLLDEALRDFVDAEDVDATLALLERFPRLLVFRTFSKAWGLAGLRCGYALGGPGAEPLLEQLAPELGVNELAQAGALEALRSRGDTPRRRAARIAEHARRDWSTRCASAASRSPASQANVLWLAAPGRDGAAELSAAPAPLRRDRPDRHRRRRARPRPDHGAPPPGARRPPAARVGRRRFRVAPEAMVIGGVIALCVVLAILAFLAPRLSRHPQNAATRTAGVGSRGASKAPGKLGNWLSKPFRTSSEDDEQVRRGRAQGPREAAAVVVAGGGAR